MRAGIRAVTKVVLLASGFSPLGVDAHAFFSTSCVSPSTLYVITAGFTVINMTWALGAFLPPHQSMGIKFLQEDSVTDFAVLPTSREDEAMFRHAFGNLSRSPSAKKHVRMLLVTLYFHLFADMIATYHPPVYLYTISLLFDQLNGVGLPLTACTGLWVLRAHHCLYVP